MGKTALWLAMALLVALLRSGAGAADEAILYRFCSQSNCADGQYPFGSLLADDAGNLYGTTSAGGAYGLGVVFKLTPGGTETVLHSFAGGRDGATPYGGLAFDASDDLIGTTAYGGGSRQCGKLGCGTVFKLALDGTETILHSFCLKKAPCNDGKNPFAGVTLDAAGNIYGTTWYGGSFDVGLTGGTVFKITTKGKEKIVWSFGGWIGDGQMPWGDVTVDPKLGILGTTFTGGEGGGTIYQIQSNGIEDLLYERFSPDSPPESGLTPDGGGNYYGTTANSLIPGTVYKFKPPSLVITLHQFTGNGGDGFEGTSGVAYHNKYLYGVSIGGDAGNAGGTIFQLPATGGSETILHWFQGNDDGAYPFATPLVANGNLYGTTAHGGSTGCGGQGCGTVYQYGPIE